MIVNADCNALADCKPKLSLGLTQNKMFARDCILAYFCRMTLIRTLLCFVFMQSRGIGQTSCSFEHVSCLMGFSFNRSYECA